MIYWNFLDGDKIQNRMRENVKNSPNCEQNEPLLFTLPSTLTTEHLWSMPPTWIYYSPSCASSFLEENTSRIVVWIIYQQNLMKKNLHIFSNNPKVCICLQKHNTTTSEQENVLWVSKLSMTSYSCYFHKNYTTKTDNAVKKS